LWKTLLEIDDISKANLIKGLLESASIPVILKGADWLDPVIFGQGGAVALMVPEEYFEEAQRILKEGISDEENRSL